ncbi:Dihydropteroate synthase [Cytophaga hutchinsonii ATCC 33406]|uniref:Dihydropteroate synthase n=2 Tax=Cytophaga hutchinsonii TaxID=985 RepID=A0A6N4SVH5_CYTH3|nr:Dihydropteroate synthase [Cytophaga hutchinsonii ATCC 33406]SFX85420.1 dihydropteroate synthase [Cytophaga hutchinsonii ATCC 33406]
MKDFKDTFFYTKKTCSARGKLIDVSTPRVMGILNITPDSFYDGGTNNTQETALQKVREMLQAGADMIDIGGYSSRPNAEDISITEEIMRVEPVIKAIRNEFPLVWLSIDTFRSEVARKAIEAGVDIINDISGGKADPEIFQVAAQAQVPYCMMHMKGTPQTMLRETAYEDITLDIIGFFEKQIQLAREKGVKDIILDPGFGFAKTAVQNFELLRRMDALKVFNLPILAGVSRKSMIYKTLGVKPQEALNGTTALHVLALQKGAGILRVHDVTEAREVITLLKNYSR